ncbi:alpha-2,8-polysialyltransferase family protein [Adlercreutzia caecimuris]|uniref:alpha-2,8-polysialyltransferase family protein n=1 Tax=Adlercreutzia caecimuris TaxID=671266 RepID=UPI001C3EEC76|nr:alpha-2,8-polysialyltransferase family protein [Adlercreutzia caecimuris]
MRNTGTSHLFIVETPFQLLVALSFCEANENLLEECAIDIAIYAQFEKAADYIERLKQCGRFREVYLVPPFYGKTKREGLNHTIEILGSGRENRRRFFENCPFFCDKNYDVIYAAGATRLPVDVKQFCGEDACTVLLEDGAGSRNGAIFKAFSFVEPIATAGVPLSFEERVKSLGKRVIDCVTGGRLRLCSRELWLFSPDQAVRDRFPDLDIREIPKECATGELVTLVMRPDSSGGCLPRVIFFAIPRLTSGAVVNVQEDIVALLADSDGWDAIARRHPRDTDMPLPSSLVSEEDVDSWEVLYGTGAVRPDAVLVGFGSTAQVSPKTIYDAEPYQVFLHRLLPPDSLMRIAAQSVMDELQSRYTERGRIFAPASMEEVRETIDSILEQTV